MPKKAHLPNVNQVRAKGRLYHYHRITGARLAGAPGSAEFAAAWAIEEAKAIAAAAPARPTDPGSYASLCAAFMAEDSDAWASIGVYTRRDYTKARDWMAAQGADARAAAELTQERAEILLDKAIKDRGYRQGCYVLQFNRRLYNWVLERAARQKIWGAANPWATVEPPPPAKREKGAPKRNRPWKPAEVIEVLFRAPLGLRRAYVLGVSGMDGSTIVTMRWAEYTNGGFDLNRGKTDTEAWAMVPGLLTMFLEEGERPSEFIATGVPGEVFTAHGLQKRSSEFLRELARLGAVGPGLTLHGLRHTLGKAVADSGGTLHAIQGALQHRSPQMALYYSAGADRKSALQATTARLDGWFDVQNPKPGDCKTLN